MAVIPFSVSSNAQLGITVNHMLYAVYDSTDLSTIIQSQAFAPVHTARTVTFSSLDPSIKYRFRLLEVLPDNTTIVREMDYFDFMPGVNGITFYDPVEIKADLTPGVVGGATSFVFDGTSGKFDWRGRNIFVERVGQGTMQRDAQYSWDTTTGTFTLLQGGDLISAGELFNVEFGITSSGTSPVAPSAKLFPSVLIVTGTTILTAGDMGKKIIIKGATSSFNITLPDLSGVTPSIITYLESGVGNHKCVQIKTVSGQVIDWLKGGRTDLKIGVCESLELYKNVDTTAVWRVHDAEGNFKTVGRMISTDADLLTQEFNCIEMIGQDLDVLDYARLYEYVQSLPTSQVVSYASWSTGDNKYKFSYSSAGVFKCPDRRNLFERNTDGSKLPGAFGADQVGNFSAFMTVRKGFAYTGGPNNNTHFGNGDPNNGNNESMGLSSILGLTFVTGNTETQPKHFITRRFVLV